LWAALWEVNAFALKVVRPRRKLDDAGLTGVSLAIEQTAVVGWNGQPSVRSVRSGCVLGQLGTSRRSLSWRSTGDCPVGTQRDPVAPGDCSRSSAAS
jgi:hypothetical protein